MAATLEEQTTTAPPPEAPVRACTTCGAGLADGQDWCLECGSAQPGRLGARHGWRAALTVLALTGVLALGAVAAAYAALSSEAQRVASAPAPPAGAPQVAAPPVQTTPTPPAEEPPPVAAPDSDPADVPEATADAGPAFVPPPAPAPAPAPSGDAGGDTGSGGDDGAAAKSIDLPADAATTYDPYDRGQGLVGDPADALDGKARTAWEAPVGAQGEVRIGLVASLEAARPLSKVAFDAETPGFTVEVYATRSAELPPDVLDARWEHVGSQRDVGVSHEVALDGKFRHVLLWVTEQPADTIVRIPEIQLYD